MFAQCPECLTIFRITTADLAAARGSMRCGHCNALFDALATLTAQLPPEPIGELARNREHESPPQLSHPVFRPTPPGQGSLFVDADDRPRRSHGSMAPEFARRTSRTHGARRNGRWIAGSALLAVVLAGQIAWAERAHWIDDARFRPWLDTVCDTLGCTLPLRRDDALLELASRDIRPHPSVPGALIVSATLHNAADFAQPFPPVQVTLSDFDEKRIAMRRFLPRDYLADEAGLRKGLAPGANAAIVFEVVDPGRNAVAFEFSFE
ncbi:MAG TPA: zinc-ribbon and DUF3426 domain-containing protein [Dokdonella sp.]|uniref:zinc-ribbon and DUF3426 domain-containing protein n=1 Tax=Dokdonella sp. TaxID=2291710 RepID=UPI0025C6FF22|nr:zinc-ribbon and DUF3426 domain-containing protein [Dokdonella sp.]MBX3691005.1 zinc-ribbon and DUF3426 domain-containing protein [Dokdonella sp.]MCW5567816.1 zinc-ribbon and DUF3426 domain-containing protein [Dokdonella sp.]HNR92298.1 zinc-ribbon and DUF3426 domain-containing protein [Dokdonella sp.]